MESGNIGKLSHSKVDMFKCAALGHGEMLKRCNVDKFRRSRIASSSDHKSRRGSSSSSSSISTNRKARGRFKMKSVVWGAAGGPPCTWVGSGEVGRLRGTPSFSTSQLLSCSQVIYFSRFQLCSSSGFKKYNCSTYPASQLFL